MKDKLLHLIRNKIKKKRISVLNKQSNTVSVLQEKQKSEQVHKNTNLKIHLHIHTYLLLKY